MYPSQSRPDHSVNSQDNAGIDEIDRQIILATQAGLPLVARPYEAVAAEVGIGADEVMSRMQAMQDSGIIRRMSRSFWLPKILVKKLNIIVDYRFP